MWACIKKTAVYKPKRGSSLGTELADCFVLDFSLADSFILDFQTWTVEIKFLLFKLLSLWDFVNGWLSWLIQAANNNDIWWYMCFNATLLFFLPSPCPTVSICKIDSQWEFSIWCRKLKLGALWLPRWEWWGEKWESQDGGDICMPLADLCWCMTESNTLL